MTLNLPSQFQNTRDALAAAYATGLRDGDRQRCGYVPEAPDTDDRLMILSAFAPMPWLLGAHRRGVTAGRALR